MTFGGFCTLSCYSAGLAAPAVTDSASKQIATTTMGCCSTPSAMSLSTSSSSCHTKCLVYAAGLVAGGAVIGYLIANRLSAGRARINCKVNLGCEKIADSVDIEDIGEKKVFCRCWKSEKFPYCDGAHNKHNKETGDNVGPLIVKKTAPAPAQ